jgi:hypothetical protein
MPVAELMYGNGSRDVDIMLIALDEMDTPMFGINSMCYYNNIKVREPSRIIGERDVRTVAQLQDQNVGQGVAEHIIWDQRYRVLIAISVYGGSQPGKRTFGDWTGGVRILDDNRKEIATFTMDKLGNLDTCGCIMLGIIGKAKDKSCGFMGLGSKTVLPIGGEVVKLAHVQQLLNEYGIMSDQQTPTATHHMIENRNHTFPPGR